MSSTRSMLRRAIVVAGVSSCCTLQLGAPALGPFTVPASSAARLPSVRMQVPQVDEETSTANEGVVGAVVPSPVSSVETTTFAGIEGAIELLKPDTPELVRLLDKVGEDMRVEMSRAEFWTNETATLLECVNVIGRWKVHTDIKERSEFTRESYREEDLRQAGTEKRYNMALRLKCSERYGLLCNAPKRPFTDEKLAASVGLTCDDFNQLPVSIAACNIVYDALAESRSGLIPYADSDARRAAFTATEDGSLDQTKFKIGLAKSRFLVIVAWFVFGKGNFVWVLVIAQALHDIRPDLFPTPKDLGLDKIGFFV